MKSSVVSRQSSVSHGVGAMVARCLYRALSNISKLPPTACILLAAVGCLCLAAHAAGAGERDGRWAIILAGVSGDADLQNEYLEEIRKLHAVLEGPLGFPRGQIVVLFDDPAKDPGLIRHKSTRENLRAVSRDLAGRVQKDDLMFVFIEGHGSYDGKTYKLNLVGPDPTAEELAAFLYSIPARRFVVVNATNCSGGSLPALSQRGKIVITATKSGMEKNRTHMGRYFVESLGGNVADSDKNGRVSVLEVFSHASRKVEEYYEREGNLQTEHPVLEDNGDAQGQSKPAPENGEGLLARTAFVDAGAPATSGGDETPDRRKLVLEAEELNRQIEALKYAKGEMAAADYEKKLEALLVQLAQINAKLSK